MESSNTPSKGSSGSPEEQHIRLACQACQRKKIKCDRKFPCTQCTRSSLQCVPSTRKPRARHAGKRAIDSELRNRISKLESLVDSLSGEVGGQDDTPGDEDADPETDTGHITPATVDKYMGSSFWSSLTTEVQALREALEEEPPDDDDVTSPSTSSGQGGSVEYDLIICPPGSVYVMPGVLPEPNQQLSATLCNIFCENVDRMFKTYHTPTLRAFMIDGKPYLGQDHTAPCNKALKAAVWFAAVNTMTDSQCQLLFGQSRADQTQLYKRLTDVALSQADLMNTNDLATLQAFVTYIASSRLTDGSRRMWTLIAIAVRIARGIGLHHESVPRSTFLTELRRRLWHGIRFLDVYSAFDRGSELLITFGSFDTPLPRNTNDSEFDESSTTIPDHESGLTDMSYAQMIYDASYHSHRLTVPELRPNGETWQQRLELSDQFAARLREKALQYCDPSDTFQRFMLQVANSMCAAMKLRAIRPIHKHVSSVPPRVDSPYVLKLASEALKYSEAIQADPDTKQWRWIVWVQWHALAVAIAGLCSIRDTDLANETWTNVELSYARNARFVADARTGMLWKPIEKLYKKASTFRDHGRSLSISSKFDGLHTNDFAPQLQSSQYSAPKLPSISGAPNQPSQLTTSPQAIPGAMPTTGFLNSPMDLTIDPNLVDSTTMNGMMDFGNGDLSWMDFERILQDMSNPVGVPLGDLHWPQNLPPGEDWNGVLNQNMM